MNSDPIVVDTADLQTRPLRCNVPQHAGTFTPKWARPEITWALLSTIPALGAKRQAELTALAWSYWSAECGIDPRQVDSAPQVTITTARGGRNNFDGPGGVLAWAFLPGSDRWNGPSLMSFDLEESWTDAPADRVRAGLIRYVAVCAHEIGHVLGFDHVPAGDLMQPIYSPTLERPQRGDAARARARYGPPILSRDVVPSTGAERLAEINRLAAEIVRLSKTP